MRELSTYALVHEALSVRFRNALVAHVREKIQTAYPDTWGEVLRRPFGKKDDQGQSEWDRIADSAARFDASKQRERRDDFDLLSVNHFINLFDVHFELLVPGDEFPVQEYHGVFKKRFLSWLSDVKEIRDPVAHPGEEDIDAAEALREVASARRVLRTIHLTDAHDSVSEIFFLLTDRAVRGLELGREGGI